MSSSDWLWTAVGYPFRDTFGAKRLAREASGNVIHRTHHIAFGDNILMGAPWAYTDRHDG